MGEFLKDQPLFQMEEANPENLHWVDNYVSEGVYESRRITESKLKELIHGCKRYLVTLGQTATNDPVPTVIINELGITDAETNEVLDPVWTIHPVVTDGKYVATLAGAFAGTVRIIPPVDANGFQSGSFNVFAVGKIDDDSIYLDTGIQNKASGQVIPSNDVLFSGTHFVEIQVWP